MRKAVILACWLSAILSGRAEMDFDVLAKQFKELPMETRRLTGPLFWLHGTETPSELGTVLGKVAEGGNGCFTAEARPHNDWLGEGWYRDLDLCLQAAKKLDLKMWIFDEDWWPSQTVGGKLPEQYGAKRLVGRAVKVKRGDLFEGDPARDPAFIALVAGRLDESGKAVVADSLVDLTPLAHKGAVRWTVPGDGTLWQVMTFSWSLAPRLLQGGRLALDGMSRDCVEWYIRTVYEPHYTRFEKDFGRTIQGYFYDEPETPGDWGTEINATFKARGVDWMPCYVAWLFALSGEAQVAAKYQYADARAETWGRVTYGAITEWCRRRGVLSVGHFMEHSRLYINSEYCAGDMMRLQKYSSMGGIDAVFNQFVMGRRDARDAPCWQTPKLASSITHVYGKQDDLALCEIFGARGQNLTYPEMKWWTDHMQVSGVNFLIPHSFNPRAPFDTDCPPYFFNGGFEPRFPLYRVWADYNNRLNTLLTGGRHVCPIALLFSGISKQVGSMITPEDLTSAIQDSLYDCDWLPFEVFEEKADLQGKEVALYKERYGVLVVPPVEVIPYPTLLKAKKFFDNGGVVIGYGMLPTKSATLGKTARDIAALCDAIWGPVSPGLARCKTSAAGGRSYFLPAKPTPEDLQNVLAGDAGIRPTLEVLTGEPSHWLHVLHRVKSGCDVFLVCNQNHAGEARRFKFGATADGDPECWDAMRNEITSVPFKRIGDRQVEFDLVLEPSESALIVFRKGMRDLPRRMDMAATPAPETISVVRDATPPERVISNVPPPDFKAGGLLTLNGCTWVWHPEVGVAAGAASPGRRYFRGGCAIPAGRKIKQARFIGTCDNAFTFYVNGVESGESSEELEGWRTVRQIDLAKQLVTGRNVFAVSARNLTDKPSPAGLIGRYEIVFEDGAPLTGCIDGTWKSAETVPLQWAEPGFDDAAWAAPKELGGYGCPPWGRFAEPRLTTSPVTSDPFVGHCEVPDGLSLARSRVFLEMDALGPEEAARVTVNDQYAGGFIGKPFRLDVTKYLKLGTNRIVIEPFAPKSARLAVWPNE